MTVHRLACSSPAKINLHLEVLGKRPDGFHELSTVFQTVSLADRIEVELRPAASSRGSTISLEVAGPAGAGVPVDGRNLAVRAAEEFLAAAGQSADLRLRLVKRIPAGGGLGGGSSNAATVLLALAGLLPDLISFERLFELAAGLGSDVPYFLVGGAALGRGRGDQIVPLPELPRRSLWLVLSPLLVSTPTVFSALGAPSVVSPATTLVAQVFVDAEPWARLWAEGRNDLQAAALQAFPALARVEQHLVLAGARAIRLSGTGATFVVDADLDFPTRYRALGGPPVRLVRVRTLTRPSNKHRRPFRQGSRSW